MTTSFYNCSWTQKQGSAWLDELQTHGWDDKTGALIYLQPWSKGNFSNKELLELEELFYTYCICHPSVYHNHVSEWQLEYPFQVQLVLGCDSHFGEASVGFMRIAYQGSDLMSFQNTSWWPSPKGGSRAQQVCTAYNQYIVSEIVHKLLSDSCPRFLLGLLDAGKAYLQRQMRPEAWLSTGPSPGPGHLLLVCHVSGFYPKPVWVMWMWGEQEQQGTWRGDLLPHADGTWYLQTSLDVKASEAGGLSCRVRHSSLGGQDMSSLQPGLPRGDSAPGASGRSGVVALEALENTLETSVHRLPCGVRSQQPRLQCLPKPSSMVTSLQL
ncbi:hypothetical protein GH733_010439, partial [Mirounga leonina]